MVEPGDDEREREATVGEAANAVVEAQVRSARSQVFRAYVASRERARELADDERTDDAGRRRGS